MPPVDHVHADRLEALTALDPAGLGALGVRVPLVAAALAGQGPLAHARAGRVEPLESLAHIVSSPVGIAVSLASCSPVAEALAQVLAWYRGAVDPERLAREAEALAPEVLAAATDELVESLLAAEGPEGLALRPGVEPFVRPVGTGLRHLVAAGALTSSAMDLVSESLRVPADRTSRRTRLECLERALGDPAVVAEALERCSADAQAAYLRLAAEPRGLPVAELGCSWYLGGLHGRLARTAWNRPTTPVHELVEAGLAWVDTDAQVCVPFLDAVVARHGRLHREWPAAPVHPVAPLAAAGGPPSAPGRVQALLGFWRRRPAEGLKSGGLGVRAVTSAAKQLGIPETDGKVLGAVARRLGLLERVERVEGSGRRATVRVEFVPSARAEAFDALAFEDRWAAVVGSWLDEDEPGPDVSFLRRTVVADLAGLAPDTGVPEASFVAWAVRSRTVSAARPAQLPELLQGLRAIGLVPLSGPVGLTESARAVLRDPASVRLGGSGRIVVQADHTVVVPPDVEPDLVARIERLATVVSEGAARVYRLDVTRIAAAAADGETAESILGTLAASGPVPAAVARLVTDAVRSTGGLRTLDAACVVVAADPAALARAVAVKAARLVPVAATVAVSNLSSAKVQAALRAKGVHLDAEPAIPPPTPPPSQPARLASTAFGPSRTLQPDRAVFESILGAGR